MFKFFYMPSLYSKKSVKSTTLLLTVYRNGYNFFTFITEYQINYMTALFHIIQ